MQVWKIIESSYPFLCPWLKVRKDHVLLPSGLELDDFYVMEYPAWVNVIAITDDDRLIIEEQYRHGLQRVNFELCAGCVEDGEEPMDAAKRELMEETGFGGGEWKEFMISAPNPNSMNNICHTFLAIGVKQVSEPHREATEDIRVHLKTKEEVQELLEQGKIIEGIMMAPLYKYVSKNTK